MSNKQYMKPTGHLQIFKVYEDGEEELHFDQNNIITSGLGVGFSYLFSGAGSDDIIDYQIRNFLVGSGVTDATDYSASTFKLKAGLDSVDSWGDETSLIIEPYYPIESGSIAGALVPFARIRVSNIHKVTNTSVRYTLVLDRNTLNGKYLNEVGLFMRNPKGSASPNPILVAYRPFTEITKTSDFSLLFRWTLQF